MKIRQTLLLLCFISLYGALAAQRQDSCTDVVYLKGGSIFRGRITEYQPDGPLTIQTWNGLTMTVTHANVQRIVQECKRGRRPAREYSFREHGLYNATRLSVLAGRTYFGENTAGYSFSHSTGWMFDRRIGAGIGAGAEIFSPDALGVNSFPVFAEIRGYALARHVTPFYSAGFGWGFVGKNETGQPGSTDRWDGGWMAKMQIGYRFGNHITVQGGLSLQKVVRHWQSFWGGWGGETGTDRILHKRIEFGIGVLL
jgi:hypothetical protein